MPRQITYRVICPSCGGWAQLRVAEPLGGIQTAPVIVMFSCVGQTDEGHVKAVDEDLLRLLPSDARVNA